MDSFNACKHLTNMKTLNEYGLESFIVNKSRLAFSSCYRFYKLPSKYSTIFPLWLQKI